MKFRTYLLGILLLGLLLILAGFLVWPALHIDTRLRETLLQQLKSSVPGTVRLGQTHLSWSSIHITDMELQGQPGTWSAQADSAILQYSLAKFVFSGFKPLEAITSLSVFGPDVTWQLPQPDSVSDLRHQQIPQKLDWKAIQRLPEAVWVNKLIVHAGVFRVQTAEGNPVISFTEINANFESSGKGIAKGQLQTGINSGRMLKSDLRLALDQRAQVFEADLVANFDSLRLGPKIGLPDTLSLMLQRLDINLRLWAKGEKTGLEGEVNLANLGLDDDQREIIKSDSLHIIIGNWRVWLPQAELRGFASRGIISGQIADLRHPIWDLRIDLHADDAAQFTQWMPAAFPLQPAGQFALSSSVTGPMQAPEFAFEASLEGLGSRWESFQNINITGKWNYSQLVVTNLNADSREGALQLQGQAEMSNFVNTAQADFQFQGKLLGLPGAAEGRLAGQFSSSDSSYQVVAKWLSSGHEYPLTINAAYKTAEDQLMAQAEIPNSTGNAQLRIEHLSKRPDYHLVCTDPQWLAKEFINWKYWDQLDGWQLGGKLEGPGDQLIVNLNLHHEESSTDLNANGRLEVRSGSDASLKGELSFQRSSFPAYNGHFACRLDDNTFTLESLDLDNSLFANGSFNLTTGEIGPSELRLSNWQVSRPLQIISPRLAEQWEAALDGRLEIYGSWKQPSAFLNLYASQGGFQGKKDFWAVVSAQFEGDSLQINQCELGRGALALVKLNGAADFKDSTLAFNLASNLNDAADLMNLLGGNPLRINGPLKMNAEVGGSFAQPEMKLQVEMGAGEIFKVPVDYLAASVLLDSTTKGLLTLQSLQADQAPDLRLEASGVLPYRGSPLACELSLKGNILKILHQIIPQILESSGQGEMTANVGQEGKQIRLQNAHLSLKEGELKFPEVVTEIRSLQATIDLDSNRVKIENLSGSVDGQDFHFSNFFPIDSAQSLLPLTFANLGFNLGIIELETNGRGIHAHIPTLMEKGVRGYLILAGKNGENHFVISGPIERPQFDGSVTVAGASITYPFAVGAHGKPSRFVAGVLRVLNSARWDLDVFLERDNRYVYTVRPVEKNTLLGNVSNLISSVEVNLNMDAGESHLKVLGSLSENTFRMGGRLVSTQGSIEYLDMQFRVERFEAEFDEFDPLPWVQGRASNIYVDSLGVNRNIYLTLYVVDPITGERQQRGRFGDFIFVLEDDAGSSQEQILAALGYSPGAITEKVTSLGGTIIANTMIRSLIRPIERELENVLQMDVIRLQPTLAQNLFENQILGTDPGPSGQVEWGAYFMRKSRLMVGKYLTDDLFLNYSGTWESALNAQNERHFGFLHLWSLDYSIRPISGNLILNLGYEYDSLEQKEDKSVSLRYSFVF